MKNILTFSSLLFLVLTSWNQIYSQSGSINNTLGSGGSFVIKDGSTTFLNLDQNDGYLNLSQSLKLPETSGSTVGVIYKGVNSFIHNYAPTGADGFNTFVGINSGNFTMSASSTDKASNNTAVGHSTLKSLTTGRKNSAFGYSALTSNTTSYQNSAFGSTALTDNTTGNLNSAFGSGALSSNTIGYQNSAFGSSALFNNTNGYTNSAFGNLAGLNLTGGSNNTFIGNSAQPSSATVSNEIVLGNGSIATLRCNAQTITSLSDRRDKKNIKYLPLGLDFLMKIKPRLFNWDRREWYEDGSSDGTKMNKMPTAGFIAQELDSVQINTGAEWLNLVLKTNPERIEATPGNLFPIVVKAIQDLKFENDVLAEENTKLQNELEILRASIADIVKAEVKTAFLRAVEKEKPAAEVSLLGSTD
jgi:hypothetical protein